MWPDLAASRCRKSRSEPRTSSIRRNARCRATTTPTRWRSWTGRWRRSAKHEHAKNQTHGRPVGWGVMGSFRMLSWVIGWDVSGSLYFRKMHIPVNGLHVLEDGFDMNQSILDAMSTLLHMYPMIMVWPPTTTQFHAAEPIQKIGKVSAKFWIVVIRSGYGNCLEMSNHGEQSGVNLVCHGRQRLSVGSVRFSQQALDTMERGLRLIEPANKHGHLLAGHLATASRFLLYLFVLCASNSGQVLAAEFLGIRLVVAALCLVVLAVIPPLFSF